MATLTISEQTYQKLQYFPPTLLKPRTGTEPGGERADLRA
jgi:hypothetical protein